ncbi:hypothetical protein CERSUDRAFT_113480 [Gelatoporia subvermispora B]|uniref:Class II aldolase/adducin N-terminal domain-containing protein n=1 Tax=Ceriporiopsis subvermispora (strain B) TaxID=914234 RepID=M2QMQ2_CERS8|nr:hypothetical protein CERSUDRAFT_113480 [Gelatoporia subvermispora B]
MSAATTSNGTEAGREPPMPTMGSPAGPPKFADKYEEREFLKFRLAQALRIFGNIGYDEGVAGHITVRDSVRPDCFWVNPFGLHFALIEAEDLILVDHDGNIQPESGPLKLLNRAAYMIHSAIHKARPDVNCAAHSHGMYGKTFSCMGRELDMLTLDSCAFYTDHSVYKNFGGVVFEAEEGQHIVEALGSKKAVILQNHGVLVASNTVEATLHYYIAMEKACQVQLLADAAAAGRGHETVKVSHEEALYTFKANGNAIGGWFSGQPHFQLLERKEGKKFQFKSSSA